MKTACSSTFWLWLESCLTLGSASTVPANMLVAKRIAAVFAMDVFTNRNYTREVAVSKLLKRWRWPFPTKSKRGNSCCQCLSADLTRT